eukprot:6107303-Alexandrium_andersonii.AAC.1
MALGQNAQRCAQGIGIPDDVVNFGASANELRRQRHAVPPTLASRTPLHQDRPRKSRVALDTVGRGPGPASLESLSLIHI